MNFALFALAIAAAFLASSLILLNFGRHLGLRYLQQQKDAANMAGLATVEGAVFALIGLLLAFTISGALQRFDERRQLVVQEANAASTAHDRLGLFEGDVGRNLLSTYVPDDDRSRIEAALARRVPPPTAAEEAAWQRQADERLMRRDGAMT